MKRAKTIKNFAVIAIAVSFGGLVSYIGVTFLMHLSEYGLPFPVQVFLGLSACAGEFLVLSMCESLINDTLNPKP
jgi:hypothetical protein